MVLFLQLCEYVKNHQITYFGKVTVPVCELCLNKDVVKHRDQNGEKNRSDHLRSKRSVILKTW